MIDKRMQIAWRMLDAIISLTCLAVVYFNAAWWVAVIVMLFGLWSFVDGTIRAKLF